MVFEDALWPSLKIFSLEFTQLTLLPLTEDLVSNNEFAKSTLLPLTEDLFSSFPVHWLHY